MYKEKTFLAITPARGGSKRLPKKNLLNLAGKPLISWSIEAGLNSKYIDSVVVSSDDEEILSIASRYDDVKLIKRTSDLGQDTASTFDVVKDVLDKVSNYDYLILLQATSPLRESEHIDEAIKLLHKKNADAIISVCEADHSPLWTNKLSTDMSMNSFLNKEVINKRSQDLEKYYRLNGAIYICNVTRFLEEKTFFLKNNIFAYEMDRKNSIDIDYELDLQIANCLKSVL